MHLSILTPTYNYGRFLDDAAQSILSQGVEVQWVIQDAVSADSTAEVARRADTTNHVTVDFKSAPDAGQSEALNTALLRAKGDWIGWLNADEFYLPNAFEKVATMLSEYPDADVIFGDCILVDENSQFLRRLSSHRPSSAVLRWYSCYLSSCAVFVRADALRKIGWDTELKLSMDWDLWLSLSAAGANFKYVPQPLAAFRVHDAQVTNTDISSHSEEFGHLRAKHGIPAKRVPTWQRETGRASHIMLKLAGGAYWREIRDRRNLSSKDMRWWRNAQANPRIATDAIEPSA